MGKRKVALTAGEEWEEASAVVVAGRDQLEAELASVYRATLHLERVRHIGSLSIMDELADP